MTLWAIAASLAAAPLALTSYALAVTCTGGWRRVVIRWQWARICRVSGAAVRRERTVTRSEGPGARVNALEPVEHLPVLLGLFGRPVLRHGARWRVWAALGQTTAELAQLADRIAATVWCQRCIVDRRSHRTAMVTFLWRDPFTDSRPWWPARPARLRPAFDLTGAPVDVPLADSWGGSWLIGASAGSGKSVWLNALLACLARQPPGTVHLLGIDLKRVELVPWAPFLDALATDRPAALQLLRYTRQLIEDRYLELAAAGLRQVPLDPTADWPAVYVVVDEMAVLLASLSKADQDLVAELGELLGYIAQLGRAAGVYLIAAAQRPTNDNVPPNVRANVQRRVLLRVENLTQAEAILGYRPTQPEIDQLDQPGLALLSMPGLRPYLARSTFGSTDDIAGLAA